LEAIEEDPVPVAETIQENLDPNPLDLSDELNATQENLDELSSQVEEQENKLDQLCFDLSFSDAVSDAISC
jgi:hypothetical protein